MMSLCRQKPGSELAFLHFRFHRSRVNVFFNGILVKSLKKGPCSHKLKIISRFILRHKTHQLHHTRDFFKLLRFLKKTVANKLINGTTCAVGDIQRHHTKLLSMYGIFQL